MHATPSGPKETTVSQPGEVIYADLEFMGHSSLAGATISLKFLDEFSNYLWSFAIKSKHATEVLTCWTEVVNQLKTQFNYTVKSLQTDNGTEFVNGTMEDFNAGCGINHRLTVPYRHEMNGRIERINRTGANAVRTMLQFANLPNSYWAEAYHTYSYIHNRTSINNLVRKTPYEILYGRKPDLSYIKIFGSVAYVRIPPEQRKKLDAKSMKCILVGYREDAAYRLIKPDTRQVVYSRDVVVDELGSFRIGERERKQGGKDFLDEITREESHVQAPTQLRRSARLRSHEEHGAVDSTLLTYEPQYIAGIPDRKSVV